MVSESLRDQRHANQEPGAGEHCACYPPVAAILSREQLASPAGTGALNPVPAAAVGDFAGAGLEAESSCAQDSSDSGASSCRAAGTRTGACPEGLPRLRGSAWHLHARRLGRGSEKSTGPAASSRR